MFLLIDNYDSFTYNLVQAFQMTGQSPYVVHNDDPQLLSLAKDPKLQAVCISPGPGHPSQAGYCMEFLKLLPTHIPVLGVCLGHQILGLYAGAEINVAHSIMHGKQSDIVHDGTGIFSNLPHPMKVGRYHSLVVNAQKDHDIFTVTARAPEGEVMALRYRDRPWVGVQFHPESILSPEGLRLIANFPSALILENTQENTQENQVRCSLEALARKENLNPEMAASSFAALMDGKMSPAQAGSFLMGLRMKGESPLELAHAIRAALARSVRIDGISGNTANGINTQHTIDVVGTGGDGRNSFNCSTATSLLLAGMGYRVVKHGNRAVSSKCGSADAVEALGFPLESDPKKVLSNLDKNNFVFLFAPHFHPSFKNIGSIRKEIGLRTLFNLLGPMINPARPSHLLMGVARPELASLVAEALTHSSLYRGAVVCGAGGYDELTPLGEAEILLVQNGKISSMTLNPKDYGILPCTTQDLAVNSKEEAVEVLKQILKGVASKPVMDMVTLNLGLAIYLLEESNFDNTIGSQNTNNAYAHMAACMEKAKEALYSAKARRFLDVV